MMRRWRQIGVACLQARVPGVTSGHQELEGGLACFSLSSQKAPALLTPGFQTSGLNSYERMKSCCSELPSWWDLVTAG